MCVEIVSSYAQCAIKSFPRMLSMHNAHATILVNYSKNPDKMQISTIKNLFFEKPFRNPSNRTQVNIKKKNFLDISPKKFGSAYAQSPRKCSNFEILAKIEGKEVNLFSKFTKGI